MLWWRSLRILTLQLFVHGLGNDLAGATERQGFRTDGSGENDLDQIHRLTRDAALDPGRVGGRADDRLGHSPGPDLHHGPVHGARGGDDLVPLVGLLGPDLI